MFRTSIASSLPELDTTTEYDGLQKQEFAIVFKHSPTCPISLFAHHQVMKFRNLQPDTPIYLVSVRRRRDVARHIAERTGVRHESPQILVLRSGTVVAAASHDEITAELLSSFVDSSAPAANAQN